jgi:hypothetical protein
MVAAVEKTLLPGDCYPLVTPEECHEATILFLYANAKNVVANKAGNYPVLGLDFQDEPIIGVFAPTIEVYLGRVTGEIPDPGYTLGPGPEGHEKATEEVFKRLIGKRLLKSAYEGTLALANAI